MAVLLHSAKPQVQPLTKQASIEEFFLSKYSESVPNNLADLLGLLAGDTKQEQ
jgi:hypothetical protein